MSTSGTTRTTLISPFQYFADPTKARPVFNGFIYIGRVDGDPTNPDDQIPIQLICECGGTPVNVTQPVRTGPGGVPIYNGQPAQIVVCRSSYSITLQDKDRVQVYHSPDVTAGGSITPSNRLVLQETFAAAVADDNNQASQLIIADRGNSIFIKASRQSVFDSFPSSAKFTDAGNINWIIDISNGIDIKGLGAVADNMTDSTTAISDSIILATSQNSPMIISSGNYAITEIDTRLTGQLNIVTEGKARIRSTKTSPSGNDDFAIRLSGTFKTAFEDLAVAINQGDKQITIPVNFNVDVGDLVRIRTTQLIVTDNRGFWVTGFIAKVVGKTSNQITIEDGAPIFTPAMGDQSITVTSVTSATQLQFNGLDSNERNVQYRIAGTSGANNGQTRNCTFWDNTTKIMTFNTAWTSTVNSGDTFRIERRTAISSWTPINVTMSGNLELTRQLQTDASNGDRGYGGLFLNYAADSKISDICLSNFSDNNASFIYSYKVEINNFDSVRANRSFSITDGTGYGIVDSASHGCIYRDGRIRQCRAGFSTVNAGGLSTGLIVRNITFEGGGTAYNGEAIYPEGTLFSYAFGGHGNAFLPIYENLTCRDFNQGTSLRDYDAVVRNCDFRGSMEAPFFLQHIRGIEILDCTFTPDRTTGMNFIRLRGSLYRQTSPVKVYRCIVNNLSQSFISPRDVGSESILTNLLVKDNFVSFNNSSGTKSGFFGTTTQVMLSRCFFERNEVDYTAVTDSTVRDPIGFLIPNRRFRILENSYIGIDRDTYYTTITDDGTTMIPLLNNSNNAISVDIIAGNGGVRCQGVMLFNITSNSEDLSPLNYSNANSVSILTSSSVDSPLDDFVNIYLQNRNLVMVNKTGITQNLIVIVRRII